VRVDGSTGEKVKLDSDLLRQLGPFH
jgi:hypothetical protein